MYYFYSLYNKLLLKKSQFRILPIGFLVLLAAAVFCAIWFISKSNRTPYYAKVFSRNVTPSGFSIYVSSLRWMKTQIKDKSMLKKATCAMNVSKVLRDSNPKAFGKYSSAWAPAIGGNVDKYGGFFVFLGKGKKSIIGNLNSIFSGYLPVGSVITSCYSRLCRDTKEYPRGGARHVALIGEEVPLKKAGWSKLYIHHNNYYRPLKGAKWQSGMISKKYLEKKYHRQWMRSKWLELKRDKSGKIVNFKVVAAPMLKILNPYKAYTKISIPLEIVKEIKKGQSYSVLNAKKISQNHLALQ